MLKILWKKILLPPCHGWVARPWFHSFPKPLFQSKAKCKASDVKMSFYSDEDETHYHKKVLLLASFWTVRFLEFGSGLLSNELFYDEGFLSKRTILKMEFLENYCSFSRLITKQDSVLLQFTTARLITIYDSVLLQFAIAWLLQFSTTVMTIYDRYYNSRHHYNSTQARRARCGTTVWNVRKESKKTKGSSNVNRSCYIFLLYQRTLCREM